MSTLLPSRLSIATGSAEPIYRQLVDQVRRLVSSGQMAAGDEMPSVREVAQALAVNPMTVSKAYALLEAEGLLLRRRGLPMQIADRAAGTTQVSDHVALLQGSMSRLLREARELGLSRAELLALFDRIPDDIL